MRVLHIGELMQLEVPAGLRVGAVALRQAVGLLFRHARYLGLIRIERSQHLGGRTLAGDTLEFRDHGFYLFQRFALTNFVATGAHALGKVEPELAMRTPLDLLAAEIAQYGAALLAVFQTGMQRAQVSRECGDMVEVVAGILAQIFARQFTGGPRLVIRVAEKIVTGNALLERGQESLQFHGSPHENFRPENVRTLYGREKESYKVQAAVRSLANKNHGPPGKSRELRRVLFGSCHLLGRQLGGKLVDLLLGRRNFVVRSYKIVSEGLLLIGLYAASFCINSAEGSEGLCQAQVR